MNIDDMPKNLQAERAVIGACLVSSEAIGIISEILKPEDFCDVNNKIAYEICLNMYLENKPVDLVTFQSEAINKNLYERMGGQPFLAELVSDVMTVSNAEYYAELVQNAALRRRIIEAGNKISVLALKNDVDADELTMEAEKILLSASSEKNLSGPISLQSAIPSVITKINELRTGKRNNAGFITKFTNLDNIITGFQPGSLNIIAARPSMGKTALALNIAQFGMNTESKEHVLFFSLEMSAEQLIHRMISAQTLEFGFDLGVGVSAMTSGIMSDYDYYMIERAKLELDKRNICIYESSGLSAMEFRAECRRFKARHPDLSLIVVDYLQLMSLGKKNNDNRQYEVAEISRVMKSVAVELECPVIALSQLSRETEKRSEKKPQLSDLRDSGAIEQDADIVMLLYREGYYTEQAKRDNSPEESGETELRVAKNRNGITGLCRLMFYRKFTRFMDYAG